MKYFIIKIKAYYFRKIGKPYLPPLPLHLQEKFFWLFEYLNHSNDNSLIKLEQIYQYLDEYNIFASSFAVCKKGCGFCCKIDVSLTPLEAIYIANKIGIYIDSGINKTSGNSSPCSFLGDKNECLIYNYRPYNCRTLFTVDNPKYCESAESHLFYGGSSGRSSEILSNLAGYLYILNPFLTIRDIRDYFPQAFSKV